MFLFFLRWGVVSPPHNPQAGGPPLVGCPWLLIQYIRSCPPCLEAFSSIRNLRTRHAVVTRDPLNMAKFNLYKKNFIHAEIIGFDASTDFQKQILRCSPTSTGRRWRWGRTGSLIDGIQRSWHCFACFHHNTRCLWDTCDKITTEPFPIYL
jgi:hypothetical protein